MLPTRDKLSRTITWVPCCASRPARLHPIKPAPPVMRIVFKELYLPVLSRWHKGRRCEETIHMTYESVHFFIDDGRQSAL